MARARVSEATVVTRLLLRAIAASAASNMVDPVVYEIAKLHPAWGGTVEPRPAPTKPKSSFVARSVHAKAPKLTATTAPVPAAARATDGA